MTEPESKYEKKGQVVEALPNTTFRVEFEDGDRVLTYLSGKMRKNWIKVVPGDEVLVEMTKYDKTKGRIVFRY